MRNFLKTFTILSVSLYLVISFIRFDLNVSNWDELGRGAFMFITIFISGLITLINDQTN
jgi:accessory gene regulator protein AgrB